MHGLQSMGVKQSQGSSSGPQSSEAMYQKQHIRNLQADIERNIAEIEMLKAKLQMKNQVIHNQDQVFQNRPTTLPNPFECGGDAVGGFSSLLCGMGCQGDGRSRGSTAPTANLFDPYRGGFGGTAGRDYPRRERRPYYSDEPNAMEECVIF